MTTIVFTQDQLRAVAARAVKPNFQFRSGPPVEDSEDLRRIIKIPRRICNITDPIAAQLWTKHLRRERTPEEGPCNCVERWGFCITEFRPAQGWALENAMDAQSLFSALGVGDGKTGIDIMLPLAIPGVQRAVLLIPPNVKPQFMTRDFPQWSAHFKTPQLAGGTGGWRAGWPILHVLTYNELSSAKNSDILKRINPDLVIADEAQNLADPNSARGGRFLRSFGEKPSMRFASQSGSYTSKSIKQYAHFLALSFRENSPAPHHPPVVDRWAMAIDASDKLNPFPCEPGALLDLCGPPEEGIENLQDKARSAYSRRLYETLGCIATSDPNLPCTLEILERKPPPMPKEVADAIGFTNANDERPDGEMLQTPLEVSAVTRRLSSGFYYRWRFPHVVGGFCEAHGKLNEACEPCMAKRKEVIEKWRAARKKWRSEVNYKCKDKIEFLDSPQLIEHAAERWHRGYKFNNHGVVQEFPPFTRNGPRTVFESEHWPLWTELRKTVENVRQAVWITDSEGVEVGRWLAQDAAQWALTHKGILWYQHEAFAAAVSKAAKEVGLELPWYGGGKQASADIILEKGDRSILASIKAHGTGKNLQYAFSDNLILNVPSDPRTWEQTIGRTYRQGQPRDVVRVEVYRHTPDYRDAIRMAQARARYIEQTARNRQRLSIATIGWEDEHKAGHWTEADELATALALDTPAAQD
jgi:hypothetical protein